ncbi:MAG: hypothetical protein ACOYJF_06830 [Prevotella sp.]|jgi:hypothetical protein
MMKTFKQYNILGALAALFLITGCSPEDYDSVDENGLPVAENTTVTASVDQETNLVTLTMEGDAIYPIWIEEGTKTTTYSTTNPLSKIYSTAGDHTVYYRVGNHNGISQGQQSVTFHIDNSLVDFSSYYTMLKGKEWRIDNTATGHLACGESGTDGTGWYSAQPNEKADMGLYDDRLTFSEDGTYTYSPGEGGTVFVNTGCTLFNNPGTGSDYTAEVDSQETTYQLSVEGEDVYMTFPANNLFPYIPADEAYNNSLKLRVESLTPSQMVLIWDNGSIAWHYILTSADEGFTGFNADSDCNLFKNCTFTHSFYYAPGWTQIDDPVVDETEGVNKFVIHLPEATTDTWQAQVFWHTDIETNSDNNYDFSCKIYSNTDHNGVTVKLAKEDDDNVYYFTDKISLKANEEYIFYKSDMAGIDMDKVKLVMDFGGNAANTDITVENIDLQEHGCDGVEAPSEDEDQTIYTYDSDMNLWKTMVDDKGTDGFTTFFYYAPGWTQIADPELTVSNGDYHVELPTACSAQWQAQVHLITTIPGEADTSYDFSCKLVPTKDINGVTIKLTDTSSDDNYFFVEQVDLVAGEETVVKIPAVTLPNGAADALKLVFDFGYTPADEAIDIYNIILQKTAN